jgi:hypothetical protein
MATRFRRGCRPVRGGHATGEAAPGRQGLALLCWCALLVMACDVPDNTHYAYDEDVATSWWWFTRIVWVVVGVVLVRLLAGWIRDRRERAAEHHPAAVHARHMALGRDLHFKAEMERHLLDPRHQQDLTWRYRLEQYRTDAPPPDPLPVNRSWFPDEPGAQPPPGDDPSTWGVFERKVWEQYAAAHPPTFRARSKSRIIPIETWQEDYRDIMQNDALGAVLREHFPLVLEVLEAKKHLMHEAMKRVMRPRRSPPATTDTPAAAPSPEDAQRERWQREDEINARYERLLQEITANTTLPPEIRKRRLERLRQDRDADIDALYALGDADAYGDEI